MLKLTPKLLALRIQPELKSKKVGGITQIIHGVDVIETGSHPKEAWSAAYEKLAATQYKVGDLVVMENCIEADYKKVKVWKCRHASFKAHSGDYAVFLENFSGYFLSAFLRKATPDEELEYHQKSSADAVA